MAAVVARRVVDVVEAACAVVAIVLGAAAVVVFEAVAVCCCLLLFVFVSRCCRNMSRRYMSYAKAGGDAQPCHEHRYCMDKEKRGAPEDRHCRGAPLQMA